MSTDIEIRLGSHRDTMNQNPLLRKAELGKPIKRGFSLPADEFIYGRPNHCIDGGAQEAMQYMVLQEKRQIQKEQCRTAKAIQNGRNNKDFIRLNRNAVRLGLVTSSEQKGAMTTLAKGAVKNNNIAKINPQKVASSRCPPDLTFGIPTRPSTPVFELLEHRYQTKWLQQQDKKQKQTEECENKGKKDIYETQAQAIRKRYDKALLKEEQRSNPKQQWQMTKFKNKKAHLNTFRSDDLKKKSFEAHEANRHTRLGKTGHGNYKQLC